MLLPGNQSCKKINKKNKKTELQYSDSLQPLLVFCPVFFLCFFCPVLMNVFLCALSFFFYFCPVFLCVLDSFFHFFSCFLSVLDSFMSFDFFALFS